ncbi:ROK family protein [Guptibacillus hwajinpoensis]|uniref:ROK family protein n=1 Tax=Guptibacillus hwajinpoensis TaxID=208199 RepID=UPI0038516B0B
MNVIGIDIGGTTIKGALLNKEMDLIHTCQVSTNAHEGKPAILSALTQVLDSLIHQRNLPISGIGIGSAGRINIETGIVQYATDNLPGWHGFPLQTWVEENYGIPTIVDNDANTALLGELYISDQLHQQSVVMLTIGTGVGGANYFFGQIVRGAHHQSGEWGHMVLYPDGRLCNCGKSGCAEQYLSGTAIRNQAQKVTGLAFEHGKEVFQQMNQNNQLGKVVENFLSDLALLIENIFVSLDPDRIILGGGVVESKSVWWDRLIEILNDRNVKTIVSPATQMNRAGMFGAAYLALQTRKEVKNS